MAYQNGINDNGTAKVGNDKWGYSQNAQQYGTATQYNYDDTDTCKTWNASIAVKQLTPMSQEDVRVAALT